MCWFVVLAAQAELERDLAEQSQAGKVKLGEAELAEYNRINAQAGAKTVKARGDLETLVQQQQVL